MASLNEKVKEESTRNRLKSELEIKLANIFYAQGNFERVIQTFLYLTSFLMFHDS